jgi:nucleoside diphosphate kinase
LNKFYKILTLTSLKKDEIQKKITEMGFIITKHRSTQLTEDIAKDMYKSIEGTPYFDEVIQMMTSGETDILMLSKENAIEGWRDAMGPVDPNKAKEIDPNS